MIYLLFGKDSEKSRKKMREIISGFEKKPAFGELFRLDAEEMDKGRIEELFRGGNIFGKKNVLVCERFFENKKNQDFVLELLPQAKKSENIFIFWEEKIDKDVFKKIKPLVEKAQEFKLSRQDKGLSKKDNRIFALTDALAERNRRQAFGLFHKLIRSGIDVEDVFWIFFWQFKNLLLMKVYEGAPEGKIAKNTGLHSFVVKKAMSASKKFKQEEVEERIEELIGLWQEVRLGNKNLSESLEVFVLKI